MVEVKIINKIEEKVKQYQENTGATATWIANKMGYKTRQAFDGSMKSEKPTLETLGRFAHFLKCDVTELYELQYTENGEIIDF